MEFIQIKEPRHSLAASMESLYLEAFPNEERKPIIQLYRHQETEHSKVFAVKDKDIGFIGMVVIIYDSQIMVIEYLATLARVRGQNYGGKILKKLRQAYPNHHMILEIEATEVDSVEKDLRMRRRKFYERNNFRFYHQTISYFGVPLELMGTRDSVAYEDYIQPYQLTYGQKVKHDILELV